MVNGTITITDGGVSEKCRLKFAIKDGIPNMVIEKAELPAGCESISQLPCQRQKTGD
jgi:hypothetical protein